MARLKELIEELKDATGTEIADIEQRGRILRDNGLIGKKGRGLSAHHVNARESLYLLIAVLINEENKDVHIRARDTGNLKLGPERAYTIDPLLEFVSKSDNLILLDALEKVVNDVVNQENVFPAIRKITFSFSKFESGKEYKRVYLDWYNQRPKNVSIQNIPSANVIEINDEEELLKYVGSIPNSSKSRQSNFGMSFDEFVQMQQLKQESDDSPIIYQPYADIIKSDRHFASESLPIIERKFTIGGQIITKIATIVKDTIHQTSDSRLRRMDMSMSYADMYSKMETEPQQKKRKNRYTRFDEKTRKGK